MKYLVFPPKEERAWQNYERLKDPAAVRPWLLKITVNCAYEQHRRNGRVDPVEELEAAAQPAD